MWKHGREPRPVLVRLYGRWRNGRRRWVLSHTRGYSRPPAIRADEAQLAFGF